MFLILYWVLFSLMAILFTAATVAFIIFILSGCDVYEWLCIAFVAFLVALIFGVGAEVVANVNTTIDVNAILF